MKSPSEIRPSGQVSRSAAERVRSSKATAQRAVLTDQRPSSVRLAQLSALANPPGTAANRTGLPASLKAGVEALSGQSLDHVRVHRNSSKPAQLNAHAYAQGSDIHLASGQEKHLPHEAWHVVQQAQGRVKPTLQAKGIAINDDAGLEREADVMGARAVQMRAKPTGGGRAAQLKGKIIQRKEAKSHSVPTAPRKETLRVAQRRINTTPPTTPLNGVTKIPDTYPKFIGLPSAKKTVHKVQATTSPADPPGMATWKKKGYLGDPSKFDKQALTRMHAIRGRFGGPARADNMFLGTALSNNFHSSSHFKEVEEPLEQYLKGKAKGETRAFDYVVTPNFGAIPGYMTDRINSNKVAAPDKAGFTKFASEHIPNGFMCDAVLYSETGGTVLATPRSQPVATDVGAPASAPVPVPAPVQPPAPAPVSVTNKVHATASENGIFKGLEYGTIGAAAGAGAAFIFGGPIGWTALAVGAAGAAYGYATAEND